MTMPEPCPVCGAKVIVTNVTEWESESGRPLTIEYDCETEPDIDGDDWWDWHRGHWNMPYVDWLPWEKRALDWLHKNGFSYRPE